jgi:hypothetical protein
MTTNAQFVASHNAIMKIDDGNAESVLREWAAGLGKAAQFERLSDKTIRSLGAKAIWANLAISRTVDRLGKIVSAALNDVD